MPFWWNYFIIQNLFLSPLDLIQVSFGLRVAHLEWHKHRQLSNSATQTKNQVVCNKTGCGILQIMEWYAGQHPKGRQAHQHQLLPFHWQSHRYQFHCSDEIFYPHFLNPYFKSMLATWLLLLFRSCSSFIKISPMFQTCGFFFLYPPWFVCASYILGGLLPEDHLGVTNTWRINF